MVTGLVANALGWRREDSAAHDRLQERLVMGVRLDRLGNRISDFQTAQLGKKEEGWTTRGIPEGRDGNVETYKSPHLRYRDYHCDLRLLLALRLEPPEETPSLDDLAAALDHPARPLFLGRKPCLPSHRLFAGWQEGGDLVTVLRDAPMSESGAEVLRMQWPDGEGRLDGDRLLDLCDERNWSSGLHGGWRPVRQGAIPVMEETS